jgi:hypothetical protein
VSVFVFRYAKLQQLIGQVSNLQIIGGPATYKTKLVNTIANMLGIRELMLLASSSTTSIRSRSSICSGLATLLTDPRKPDSQTGNFIESDLLHAAYQTDSNATKLYGSRRPGGPIVVTANSSVLGSKYVSDQIGRASLERITTLTLSDSEVNMTPDGKRLTNSVKDHPGKLIPFLAMVGKDFSRESANPWINQLKTLCTREGLENLPDRQYRDRAVQCWHAQALNECAGTELITVTEFNQISKESFLFFTEEVNGGAQSSPEDFWVAAKSVSSPARVDQLLIVTKIDRLSHNDAEVQDKVIQAYVECQELGKARSALERRFAVTRDTVDINLLQVVSRPHAPPTKKPVEGAESRWVPPVLMG